jgi:hypothetical protein
MMTIGLVFTFFCHLFLIRYRNTAAVLSGSIIYSHFLLIGVELVVISGWTILSPATELKCHLQLWLLLLGYSFIVGSLMAKFSHLFMALRSRKFLSGWVKYLSATIFSSVLILEMVGFISFIHYL